MNKKKILLSAVAICVVAILSVGSLAWFTDSDFVTNNFHVADSETTDPDDVFGIDVWENYNSDGDETPEIYDKGINYEDILPGDDLEKVAYLENTGVHPQYVRALVTVSGGDIFIDSMADVTDYSELLKGVDTAKWSYAGVEYVYNPTTGVDELQYMFYYNAPLAAGETVMLFDEVEIPFAMTLDQAMSFADNMFTIDVLAQVIQSENLDPSVYEAELEAKAAFDMYWPADTSYEAGTNFAAIMDKYVEGDNVIASEEASAYYLLGVTAEVENGVVLEGNAINSTVWLDGCSFTLPEGGQVISVDEGSMPVVVYVSNSVTVNGITYTNAQDIIASGYFENATIIYMGNEEVTLKELLNS